MTDLSAMNSSTFSGRQFKVFVAEDGVDTDTGGADVATVGEFNTTAASYMALDTEGITFPSFSPNQEFEMRAGTGRVAEFGQMFSSSKGVVTEFTISGRLDQQALMIFMENVTGEAASLGTDPDGIVTLATGYAGGTNMKHGDTVAADQFEKTLSFYFQGPTAADSYKLHGCVCSNLQITADMGTASGRYDYSATFRTQYKPGKGAVAVNATIPSTQMFLSNMSIRHLNMLDVGGSSFYKYTPFFNSISLTIDAPPVFIGAQGDNAEPEVIGRALPEMNITFAGSIKYDEASDNLIEAHRDPNQNSYIQFVGTNKALTGTSTIVPTDGNFASDIGFADHDDLEFSFLFHKAKLISASVGSGDVATVDFEAKVVDDGTRNILVVATGDSSSS